VHGLRNCDKTSIGSCLPRGACSPVVSASSFGDGRCFGLRPLARFAPALGGSAINRIRIADLSIGGCSYKRLFLMSSEKTGENLEAFFITISLH